MFTKTVCFVLAALLLAVGGTARAGNQGFRIATYNIEWFGGQPSTQGRIQRLTDVIANLQVDVIALQEIKDRATLRQIFPVDQWQIVIDDQSGENQDVALAIRLPFRVVGQAGNSNDIDADDSDFLFPNDDPANEWFFPKQRDVLFAEIEVPDSDQTFTVMVVHAKSRLDSRVDTDPRREGAAVLIVQAIESRFDGEDVILLGDFNDNPDDRSLNILETGDENAAAGPDDNSDDTFMVNLTQPFLIEDRVSWGLTAADIVGGILETRASGSRQQNNDTRGTEGEAAPILFDQILVTADMLSHYTVTSIGVFDNPIAQDGHFSGGNSSGQARDYASDHTPVIAEFTAGNVPPDGATPPVGMTPQPPLPRVRIIELLPNPTGDDSGHETVTLKNFGEQEVALTGWRLIDKAGNEFALEGILQSGAQQTITLPSGSLPLNNSGGDEITLFSDDGTEQDKVRYSGSEVNEGQPIAFGS